MQRWLPRISKGSLFDRSPPDSVSQRLPYTVVVSAAGKSSYSRLPALNLNDSGSDLQQLRALLQAQRDTERLTRSREAREQVLSGRFRHR
jgi:hypothetical protein